MPRVLLALSEPTQRAQWIARLNSLDFDVHAAPSCGDTCRLLSAAEFDAILIKGECENGPWARFRQRVRRHAAAAQIIALLPSAAARATIEAVRSGATDILTLDSDDATLRERLKDAARRSAEQRERAESAGRLRSMCHKLTAAVHDSEQRIESLTRDVLKLAEDTESRISEAALAAEFRAILSQELDLESLLRTVLQYLLKKTGPTNAAVFLPDAEQHYSLGAYVNYDCDREAADLLLEHVCGSICPHLRNEEAIIRFEDGDDLARFLGEQASIIRDRDVVAFRCAHEGRTFAIVMLFRDRSDAFSNHLPGMLDTLRPIFAAQLKSILRVHHRARPQWPKEAAEDVTESDDDFGFGIAA